MGIADGRRHAGGAACHDFVPVRAASPGGRADRRRREGLNSVLHRKKCWARIAVALGTIWPPGSPMTFADRQAVLILGMHRSGTSAVAGAVNLLGVAPPARL